MRRANILGAMPIRVALARLLSATALLAFAFLLLPGRAAADGGGISSAGPLTQIITTPDLNCQVAHHDDAAFEFFPSESTLGSCGTFLAAPTAAE